MKFHFPLLLALTLTLSSTFSAAGACEGELLDARLKTQLAKLGFTPELLRQSAIFRAELKPHGRITDDVRPVIVVQAPAHEPRVFEDYGNSLFELLEPRRLSLAAVITTGYSELLKARRGRWRWIKAPPFVKDARVLDLARSEAAAFEFLFHRGHVDMETILASEILPVTDAVDSRFILRLPRRADEKASAFANCG